MSSPSTERAREAIRTMEREHALEIELVRELQAALGRGDREESESLFDRLEEFTVAHFLAEQLAMGLYDYPGLEAHRREHDDLIAELRALRTTLSADEPTDPAAAVARLERWLFAHMNGEDRELADYLTTAATDPPPPGDSPAGD